VARLDAGGSELLYSSYIGGSRYENSAGVDVDSDGNAYVAGYTDSPDFPTLNAMQATPLDADDIFIVKWRPIRCGGLTCSDDSKVRTCYTMLIPAHMPGHQHGSRGI
jgi:hypothetical protein